MALGKKAGYELKLKQDVPDASGTPNDIAASMYSFVKQAGRPAGPSGSSKAKPPTTTKKEARAAKEYEAAIIKLQKWWRGRCGKFTSRGRWDGSKFYTNFGLARLDFFRSKGARVPMLRAARPLRRR